MRVRFGANILNLPHHGALLTAMAFGWCAMSNSTSFADEATTSEVQAATDSASSDWRSIKAMDCHGKMYEIGRRPGTMAAALVFISTECPISNKYVPELNQLADKYADNGIEFYGVVADRQLSRQAAVKYADEFKLKFPLLFDGSGILARQLRATRTPEVIVVDPHGHTVYRGRIDNRWPEVGEERTVVTEHDLADVLSAVVAGDPIARAETTPVGCPIELPAENQLPSDVTYTRDIAPILLANCVNCHRPGEVAPFSLLTYSDAAKRAKWLHQMTDKRLMPPWKAEPNYGHFDDEQRLTDAEVQLIAAWAKAGAPEGDAADLPPAPEFPQGWRLGEPDLVIEMPDEYTVPADGRDIFQYFVAPIDIDADRHVEAVEFRPGNPAVVHHAILFLDHNGAARKLDEKEPGPGYRRFGGPGFAPTGSLGGWAPGYTARRSPPGIGRLVKKGSDLVIQIHYHPIGQEQTDRSKVGIYFAKAPVQRTITGVAMAYRQLQIPAGEKNYAVKTSFTVPVDVELIGVTPHMHLLGKTMKAYATLPDGRVEPLVWVKSWDWNWQNQYRYAEHVQLPKGAVIEMEASYDNSADNPANPNSPPKHVGWGQETKDEMCFLFIDAVPATKRDQATLREAQLKAAFARQINWLKRLNPFPSGN